jgi:hypothetical protein
VGTCCDVFGQRYHSAGNALGGELRVNSYTTDYQRSPAIASDAIGNFVVVWHGPGQGQQVGIFGQRYDSAGNRLGSEFRVNSYPTGAQEDASVASDASGNFVIVWKSAGPDGSSFGVFGQRYDSAGVPQGGEFQVNSFTPGNQWFPSVASDASGDFIVVWGNSFDGNGEGISGQRYDSGGAAQGAEFQVNTYTTDRQKEPSVAANGPSRFIVVWSSEEQDGDEDGVFGQRFDFGGETIHGASWRAQVKTLVHDDGHGPSAERS